MSKCIFFQWTVVQWFLSNEVRMERLIPKLPDLSWMEQVGKEALPVLKHISLQIQNVNKEIFWEGFYQGVVVTALAFLFVIFCKR